MLTQLIEVSSPKITLFVVKVSVLATDNVITLVLVLTDDTVAPAPIPVPLIVIP